MPTGKRNASAQDLRITELKKMSGHDFAMEVSRDLIVLPKEERAKAVRMIQIVNETITRESTGA